MKLKHINRFRPNPAALATVCFLLCVSAAFVFFRIRYLSTTQKAAPAIHLMDASAPLPSQADSFSSNPSKPKTPEPSQASPSAKANPAFFSGTTFVGDSLTDDIKLYEPADNAAIVAESGLSTYTAVTTPHTINGSSVMIADAVADTRPQRIYIMLGSNDLEWMTTGQYTDYYGRLVDAISEKCPDAAIEIESTLPVTEKYEQNHSDHTNARIERFNAVLRQFCSERGLKYLDVASYYKDGSGRLPSDESDDGMHLRGKYYANWFEYLKANS